MWHLEEEKDVEQLREVTEGEESYYRHTLHVLTKGRRARTDHCIIRESNGHVH